MATKKKLTTTPTEPKGTAALPHEILLMPSCQNAVAMEAWGQYAGKADLDQLVKELREQTKTVKGGDMAMVESMLYGQAVALQTVFTSLARRAALNAGEYINASETYMKLALRAQSQCRATLETLAIIKNPMPYIKQANIANGPQQVNNGKADQYAQGRAHAENFKSEQNQLLEDSHGGTYLDTGAAPAAARSNPAMEAVEQVHRAAKPKG
jgi:hypothetical protein